MTKTLGRTICTCLWIACSVTAIHAQDSHHWNLRYGTRAELLNGSVIGSRVGLSATFYNPGTLALVPDPKLFTTALAGEYSQLKVTNVPARADDLKWSSTGSSPSLVAGLFYNDKKHKRLFGYSYLTRQKFDFEIDDRVVDDRDAFPTVPGDEYFAGELITAQKAEEIWVGFTSSQRLGDKLGLGGTLYGAYRTQRTRYQTVAQAVSDSGQGAASTWIDDYRYSSLRLLAKLGWAFDLAGVNAGLSLTTPSLQLAGSGSSFLNRSIVVDDTGVTPNAQLESNLQEDLDAEYKSSWAVGLGATQKWGQTGFHIAAEWFNAVPEYVVLKGEPFVGQTTGDTIPVVATQELRSVINLAIGLEQGLSKSLKLYGGFSTDYSAAVGDDATAINSSTWNIYHASVGAEFVFKRIEFTLGTTVSWGGDTIDTRVDLDDPQSAGNLVNTAGEVEVRYTRLKLILGFTLPV